ncbi:hypothetical protein JHK86_004412 [Glycine max]|nr:hypothetical protein JHK86_004412 [Glycine max]
MMRSLHTIVAHAAKNGLVKPEAIAFVAPTWAGPLPIVFGRDSNMETRYFDALFLSSCSLLLNLLSLWWVVLSHGGSFSLMMSQELLCLIQCGWSSHMQDIILAADDQLNMFKEYIGKLNEVVGETRATNILAKHIFIISMGSNNIVGTYFMTPYQIDEYNVEEYTSMLVNTSLNFLQVCF